MALMKELNNLMTLEQISVTINGRKLLSEITFSTKKGEQWAILGPSGSGKTLLGHALIGRVFHSGTIHFEFPDRLGIQHRIIMVEQQHHFRNLSNTTDFYYQQRFNSMDASDSLTVNEYLNDYFVNDRKRTKELIQLLKLTAVLDEPMIQLSNGENKRLQFVIALLKDPDLLILDSPFTGLDVEGRQILDTVIRHLIESGIHIIILTADAQLPNWITHAAVLNEGSLIYSGPQSAMLPPKKVAKPFDIGRFNAQFPRTWKDFDFAIRMRSVNVRYADRSILKDINWEVRKGERWNVSGPNGAGKSTLLSLVNGDNPQAYSNEIYLFDRRRGSGESIWDIKKNTGFVSPELHLFFNSSTTIIEVIGSGFFDTIGLFRQLSDSQLEQVRTMQALLNLDKFGNQLLAQLSLGQQRMALLGRALIKNPPLLILDEPCQGLDVEQADFIKHLIDSVCETSEVTLLYVSHYEKDIPNSITRYLRLTEGAATIK